MMSQHIEMSQIIWESIIIVFPMHQGQSWRLVREMSLGRFALDRYEGVNMNN